MEGSGRAIVCAVGERSRKGLNEEKEFASPDVFTALKERLENLANQITSMAIKNGIIIFVLLTLHLIVTTGVTSSKSFSWFDSLTRAIDNFTLMIALIIMGVPEGLPLAVNITLAFIVQNMRKNNVLIKNIESPEKVAHVRHICTGKTATLTTNKMKVELFYANSRLVNNKKWNTLTHCDYEEDFVNLIKDAIVYNCESRVEVNDESKYEATGNGTECGMINLLQECDFDVNKEFMKKEGKVLTFIPHNSYEKRSIAVALLPNEQTVRVFVKGAPEILAQKCSKTYNTDNKVVFLNEDELNYITNNIMDRQMCPKSLRTILYAYKDMNIEQYKRMQKDWNNFRTEDERDILVQDLTLIGVFGLRDELRKNVEASVMFADIAKI